MIFFFSSKLQKESLSSLLCDSHLASLFFALARGMKRDSVADLIFNLLFILLKKLLLEVLLSFSASCKHPAQLGGQ